jgi:hypothetical protein
MESANKAASVSTAQDTANAGFTATDVQAVSAVGAPVKPADSRVFVQVHSTDVEAIRAVLALTPARRRGFPTLLWLGVALALLVAAFAGWQWTVSTAEAAENAAPPQIEAPKPPDFAFNVSAPAPPTQPDRSRTHSRRGRAKSGAGN